MTALIKSPRGNAGGAGLTVTCLNALPARGDFATMNSSESAFHLSESAIGPELIVLAGHTAPVESAVFSPDGTQLATSGRDGQVILWECESGMVRRVWQHEHGASWLAFSPNGQTLATTGHGIDLWNVDSGRWEGRFPVPAAAVQFSPDGAALTAVEWDQIVCLDSSSGHRLREIPLVEPLGTSPPRVAFSADGSTVAAAAWDNRGHHVRIWDLPSGTLRRLRRMPRTFWWKERDSATGKLRKTHGAQADVQCLALSPDGRRLAVGGHFTLWICDTHTGRRTHFLACGCSGYWSLAFSGDGELLAAGGNDGVVTLWRVRSGEATASAATGSSHNWISAVAFNRRGDRLATGTHKKQVDLWRPDTGERNARFAALDFEASALAYSPDGGQIAVSYTDGTLRLWSARTGHLVWVVRTAPPFPTHLEFSADGRTLRSGRVPDPLAAVWNAATGELIQTAGQASDAELGNQAPRCEGIAPDGQLKAVSQGWEGRIELRSTDPDQVLKVLPEIDEPDLVVSLTFSPDSRILAAGYHGFRVRLWNVETGRLLQLLLSHGDANAYLAFSLDGTQLAVGGNYDSEVVLCNLVAQSVPVRLVLTRGEKGEASEKLADFWDVPVEQVPTHDINLVGHTGNIRGVAYSPDGRAVATVAADAALKLWDPINGRLRATLLPLPSPVSDVSAEWIAYTPEGNYVASAGGHGYVGWRLGTELLPGSVYANSRCDSGQIARSLDSNPAD